MRPLVRGAAGVGALSDNLLQAPATSFTRLDRVLVAVVVAVVLSPAAGKMVAETAPEQAPTAEEELLLAQKRAGPRSEQDELAATEAEEKERKEAEERRNESLRQIVGSTPGAEVFTEGMKVPGQVEREEGEAELMRGDFDCGDDLAVTGQRLERGEGRSAEEASAGTSGELDDLLITLRGSPVVGTHEPFFMPRGAEVVLASRPESHWLVELSNPKLSDYWKKGCGDVRRCGEMWRDMGPLEEGVRVAYGYGCAACADSPACTWTCPCGTHTCTLTYTLPRAGCALSRRATSAASPAPPRSRARGCRWKQPTPHTPFPQVGNGPPPTLLFRSRSPTAACRCRARATPTERASAGCSCRRSGYECRRATVRWWSRCASTIGSL